MICFLLCIDVVLVNWGSFEFALLCLLLQHQQDSNRAFVDPIESSDYNNSQIFEKNIRNVMQTKIVKFPVACFEVYFYVTITFCRQFSFHFYYAANNQLNKAKTNEQEIKERNFLWNF